MSEMRFFAGAMAVAALAGAVRADQVLIRQAPPYSGVIVSDVKEGAITFRMSSGVIVTKSLADVEMVQLDGKDAFNRAEKLRPDANLAATAVTMYGDAAASMSGGWQAKLLAARRMSAAERSGAIDVAVKDWLAAMDESPSPAVVNLRPKLAGTITGGPAAIKALEDRLRAVKDAAYQSAIQGLLVSLYEKEGLKDKAALLAEKLSGESAPQGLAAGDMLRGLRVRLEKGEAKTVLAELEKQLPTLSEADLPLAMLLAGKARLAASEGVSDASARRKELLAAGLDFMRVYANYPAAPQAAESLFLAGTIHTMLPQPNHAAAKAAFEKVIQQYAATPFAASAKQALAKIPK